MAPLEQLIEEARRLPTAEKRRLRDALDRELQSAPTYPTHDRERAWIEANRDEYLGQWVVLDGDKLLAHGRDARTVYEAAKSAGGPHLSLNASSRSWKRIGEVGFEAPTDFRRRTLLAERFPDLRMH